MKEQQVKRVEHVEVAYLRYAPTATGWRWAGNALGRQQDTKRRNRDGDRPPRRMAGKHQGCASHREECGRFQCQWCERWFPFCWGVDDEHPDRCDKCWNDAQAFLTKEADIAVLSA
jgi:hypothetical protein